MDAFTPYERRWRAAEPRVRVEAPAPRAFDRAAALRAYERVHKDAWWSADWSTAALPHVLAREEAVFWLHAASARGTAVLAVNAVRTGTVLDLAVRRAREELETLDVHHVPDRDTIARRLAGLASVSAWGSSYREVASAVSALIGPLSTVELALDEANDESAYEAVAQTLGPGATARTAVHAAAGTPFAYLCDSARHDRVRAAVDRGRLNCALAAGVAAYVVPYLDDREFARLRTVVRDAARRAHARVAVVAVPHYGFASFAPAYYLAAALHLTDEVETIAKRLPAKAATQFPFLDTIVYGLRTAGAIVDAARHIALALDSPGAVREWLATTGDAGLAYAREQIAQRVTVRNADALAAALGALGSPAVSREMLRLTATPAAYVAARSWLEAHIDAAVPALAEAVRRQSALTETANEILRRFARRGNRAATAALDATVV